MNPSDVFPEQGCVTWIKGAETRDVVNRFGGDHDRLRRMTWDEVYELTRMPSGSSSSHHTMTVEPPGSTAAVPTPLRDISAAGEAFSLFWTVSHDVPGQGRRISATPMTISNAPTPSD
jgi:hypothetical protein